MAENPFRILLDFRELNFKFYKFVWMSISPRELVTIRDLKDAILKKFSFEQTDLQLFLRDGLLPEDENITNILRENDNVRLFYSEPSYLNQNELRTENYETIEEPSTNIQAKSSEKCETHSDVLESSNARVKSSKKRKLSFSNGTYVFKNNNTPKNSSLINVTPDNIESITSTDLYTFENEKHCDSDKIRKKLKYTNEGPQNSVVYENGIILPDDIFTRSEKNESKFNFSKKKKKHRHSKDASENEIAFHDNIVAMSEINKNEPKVHKKKKKHKHSHDASKLSETAVSFYDEVIDIAEKLDDSITDLERKNEPSELRENFETVTDNSEVLKLASVSFSTSSINTSSGISSLKASEEDKISSEQNCSKSYVSDSKRVPEIEDGNLSVSQGNSCKKKKRKRHRKRKSLLIDPQVDETNDCSLDMSSQKNESLNSSCASSYQITEIDPKILDTSDNSKFNAFHSARNANCSEAKSSFLEPFTNYITCTSTPFLQTPVISSAFPRNNIFKMPKSSNASQDQSCSVTTSEKANLSTMKKKMNENFPSSVAQGTVLNHNRSNINNCSTDSLSNLGIKSRFLDPHFSYKGCPPLNSCPLVGTRIAYKVLELDASYSPVVSNYKEGLVKAVNSQTDELEIELIEPEVKEGRTGKFENLYEDELPSSEVIRKVTLNWPSLIDPVQVVY